MLVLDIPTPNHIPSLIKAFEDPSYFARFRSATEEERKERRVHAVFHLCGDGVLEDERYKTFMNTFSLDTQVRIRLYLGMHALISAALPQSILCHLVNTGRIQ